MKIRKSNITIFIGTAIFIITFLPFLPSGIIMLNFLIGAIGIIGALLSNKLEIYRKIKLLILNTLVFFSFFIAMFLGYIVAAL
ncbi:hypothetical protein [Dethiothermospora halolimnae]|uniref:hypothetical protein n=1 Tax=Dethiothermospora halolimnae TaxID=3114390 RepID=UPI003CCBDC99